MKPVYSNPKGHHIHSPFAFELVSKVIFRSDCQAEKDLLKTWDVTHHIKRRMLLIRRLIEFFQPENIWVPSGKVEMMKLVSDGLQEVKTEYYENTQLPGFTFRNEFVIVDKPVGIPEMIPVTDCNSVWFICSSDMSEKGDYFSGFKNHPKVSQTYALKNCGIVIFKTRYKKQDFIIRGNYSI